MYLGWEERGQGSPGDSKHRGPAQQQGSKRLKELHGSLWPKMGRGVQPPRSIRFPATGQTWSLGLYESIYRYATKGVRVKKHFKLQQILL